MSVPELQDYNLHTNDWEFLPNGTMQFDRSATEGHAAAWDPSILAPMLLPVVLALGLAADLTAATSETRQELSPPLPPGCEGKQCRRAKCGDICTETDCSHFGNVCAGGARAPTGPGWTYSSKFAAPELPSAFTSENATIFYYFNLVRHLPAPSTFVGMRQLSVCRKQ